MIDKRTTGEGDSQTDREISDRHVAKSSEDRQEKSGEGDKTSGQAEVYVASRVLIGYQ